MKFKHIHFIVNPASGKEEPVLFYINRALIKKNIRWDVSVTKKDMGAGDIARTLIGKTDLIAVYGGDGCVTKVASVLYGSGTPMAIIPGGTANVMAKELGIPLETTAALEMIANRHCKIKKTDMGLMNGYPFLLRVNLGIMADMVLKASRSLKDDLGQLAYGVTAVKTMIEAVPAMYRMQIDGKEITESGVSLTITNSGNIGVGDFDLQPGISITDGLLDIILLKDTSFLSLLKVAGSTLMQNKTEALVHWKCKEAVITLEKSETFICDDFKKTAKKITIKVMPASIKILVPATVK